MLPCTTETLPPLLNVKSNGCAFTVRVKAVVCVTSLALAVTVTVAGPVAAVALAVSVSVVLHVGVQFVGLNDAVTPVGKPETLKLVASAVPDDRVAVTLSVTLLPCTTDTFPPLLSVKSNGCAFTVRVKAVVCVTEPAVPVTVIVAGPVAAVALAVSVNVVLHVGAQLVGLNDAVTPVGNPETL